MTKKKPRDWTTERLASEIHKRLVKSKTKLLASKTMATRVKDVSWKDCEDAFVLLQKRGKVRPMNGAWALVEPTPQWGAEVPGKKTRAKKADPRQGGLFE